MEEKKWATYFHMHDHDSHHGFGHRWSCFLIILYKGSETYLFFTKTTYIFATFHGPGPGDPHTSRWCDSRAEVIGFDGVEWWHIVRVMFSRLAISWYSCFFCQSWMTAPTLLFPSWHCFFSSSVHRSLKQKNISRNGYVRCPLSRFPSWSRYILGSVEIIKRQQHAWHKWLNGSRNSKTWFPEDKIPISGMIKWKRSKDPCLLYLRASWFGSISRF